MTDRSWFGVVVLVLFSVIVCGCSHKKNADDPSESPNPVIREAFSAAAEKGATVGHTADPHTFTPTELRFGRAPQPAPGLVYQDGIVLMEHGDKALRGVGSDGLTWLFDANAPHANEIQVDKIVFATDRCVGKVLDVQRSGDELKVILGPVQITDVIKQGHFVYDQPVDMNSFIAVAAPDYPGAPGSDAWEKMKAAGQTSSLRNPENNPYGEPRRERPTVEYGIVSPSGEWRPMPTISPSGTAHLVNASWHPPVMSGAGPAFMQAPYFPNWPQVPPAPLPTIGGVPQVQIPGLSMHPCFINCDGGGIGLHLYADKQGMKVDLTAVLHMSAPHLHFNIDVSPGYVKTAAIELSGAAGFTITLRAGAMQDLQANLHEFGQVPLEIQLPVTGLGVPLVVRLVNTFKLDTGFSAKTSMLVAKGDFTASGALTVGYINNNWGATGMKMTLKQNLADAVGGVSVGINSLVFGINQTLMVGLGAFGFATGPYVGLTSTITALDQSSIAMRPCRQGTFQVQVYAGIGWSIPKVIASVVNFLLGLAHVKPVPASGDILRMKNPLPLVDLKDDLPLHCASGAGK